MVILVLEAGFFSLANSGPWSSDLLRKFKRGVVDVDVDLVVNVGRIVGGSGSIIDTDLLYLILEA